MTLDAIVGLGANLGPRAATLASAVRALGRSGTVISISSLLETEPLGPAQPDFLNAAVRMAWAGSPRALFETLLEIERAHGRVRAERWGPRTLDLDLLFITGVEVREPDLLVPHPGLLERAFALIPLLELLPDAVHPGTLEPLASHARRLPVSGVRRVSGPEWALRPEAPSP